MESSLEVGFLRAAEKAAIAAARTMGYGKRKYSDQVAVEAMREELNRLKMRGSVVIGEGERDKAPMINVGKPLGSTSTKGKYYLPVSHWLKYGLALANDKNRKNTHLSSSHIYISHVV